MIVLRSTDEIRRIREAGRITALALKTIEAHARIGTTTDELDAIAHTCITRAGGIPAFKGYKGYPAHICTSLNEVVVHGIPSGRTLKDGDILSVDVGVKYGDYYADAAVTLPIGKIDKETARLLQVTKDSLSVGIAHAIAGKRLSDISASIQEFVEKNGFSVVRAFVGHGIGTNLHEEPEVPNYGKPNRGPRLEKGMILALEPMVNAGTFDVEVLEDGWTVVTKDRKRSAHFEHTIAILDDGALVLTQPEEA